MVFPQFVLKLTWAKESSVPYPPPNTTFFIPKLTNNYIQTQITSDCDVYMGAHDLASSVLYQITRNHVNNDVNDNDDPQSFETPRKHNHSSTSSGDKNIITTTPVIFKDHIFFYQKNNYKMQNL